MVSHETQIALTDHSVDLSVNDKQSYTENTNDITITYLATCLSLPHSAKVGVVDTDHEISSITPLC